MKRKKKTKTGLLASGRVAWFDPATLGCIEMAKQGLFASTISYATGLSVQQIYYRCKQYGISTTDWRRGKTEKSQSLVKKYSVVGMEPHVVRRLQKAMRLKRAEE